TQLAPQAPQFNLSELRSVHWPLQRLWPDGQLFIQRPVSQLWPEGQTTPQPPQLLGSAEPSSTWPLQQIRKGFRSRATQPPPQHSSSSGERPMKPGRKLQLKPHWPQLFRSELRSRHWPLHELWPVGQQMLLVHSRPPEHCSVRQIFTCCASLCVT